MTTPLETAGAQPQKQPKYVPIFMDSSFTGLFTQRAALHDPSDYWTKRYGGRPDALWKGSNIELTNNLTLKRRPGLSIFGGTGFTYPTPPLRAFSFQLTSGAIQVIIDTGSSGSFALSSVNNAVGTSTTYNGTITGGASNAYAGLIFNVTGFVNGPNNGAFVCTASTATTLVLTNSNGVAETTAATAISAGAVYVDNQNGTATQLFAKSPGAGQTFFASAGGVLYMGDGVDTKKYTPGNTNGTVWNWGIAPPTVQPSVTTTASVSASVGWTPNVIYTPFGLTVDANGIVWQLNGVNADGSNTAGATIGTSANGNPNWNQSIFATTVDNTVTWKNLGQLQQRVPGAKYGDAGIAGPAQLPVCIWVPNVGIYLNFNNNGNASTASNATTASLAFTGAPGSSVWDGGCHWFFFCTFAQAKTWVASHVYANWYGPSPRDYTFNNAIFEPFILPPPTAIGSTPVFMQVPSIGGTSNASYPPFTTTNNKTGSVQPDGQLSWLSMGTGTWAAQTAYTQWQAQGTTFGVVNDGVNMQVCVGSGVSDTNQPGTTLSQTFTVANAVGNNTSITGTFTTPFTAGRNAVLSGFSNAANNGTFQIVSCNTTTLVIQNPSGVAETTAATIVFNPWGGSGPGQGTGTSIPYGTKTQDGSPNGNFVTWVCVGPQFTWVANTKWYLPTSGFVPPQASQKFGGATISSNTSLVETCVNPGKSGAGPSQPSWGANQTYTPDNDTVFTLTSVTVSATQATYNGTITGGGSNAYAGFLFVMAGFTNAGNNGAFTIVSSTATTLVVTLGNQVAETHAGTASGKGLIWFAEAATSTQSLTWTKGYTYAYSYKARSLTDLFSPLPLGGGVVPPGINVVPNTFSALQTPTGSETNAISSASPVTIISGGNTGAVNTISGPGSLDPQVDTIVIWRSADGGSSATMFELTEIPAPPVTNGAAGTWSFQDFLPDTPQTVNNIQFPGLNNLSPAPINGSNNPPTSTFQPMLYNFQRIWGADGTLVRFSGGPDVSTGNPNEAFLLADNLPFLAPVLRIVKSTQGMFTFLTDNIEIIGGGPATSTFFSVSVAPGVGLGNFNALDVYGGEFYFFGADNQFRTLTPSLNIANAGFPVGDQLANQPSSGVSDTTWTPSSVYCTVHQQGIDNAVFLADGSSGWYRLNPHQVPGAAAGPEPIWSPFAHITNGTRMVQSVETAPGVKQLLVGGTSNNTKILQRNLNVFTDNGTQYDAFFEMGNITMATPGSIAILKFLEFDFSGTNFLPTVSYLLNEISGSFTPFKQIPQFDPPQLYGATLAPGSYSPNRYYFSANASVARCRHLRIKVDFGSTSNADEMYAMTIFGRKLVEV